MGRKKKFIEKGEGVKFYLVHRSQKDPLYLDENLGEHVLMPADSDVNSYLVQAVNGMSLNNNKSKSEKDEIKNKRLEEQQKFGIYYDDDYDYLQHLKEVDDEENYELDEAVQIGNVIIKNDPLSQQKLTLPSSVFASKFEEETGYFNQAAPNNDPKIGWDPDIVRLLDDDTNIDFEDKDNELEDDFFVKANDIEKPEIKNQSLDDDYREDYEDDSDDGRFENNSECQSVKEFETKSRFSNYSMSSSVIRRNEKLQYLDDHFEKIFAQYDEDQIGPLDMEEINGYRKENDAVLESALDEFDKLIEKKTYLTETNNTKKVSSNKLTSSIPKLGIVQEEGENSSHDSSETEIESEDDDDDSSEKTCTDGENDHKDKQYEVVRFTRKKVKEDRLDCESVVSTYSNLYNRPAIITEKSPATEIKLSKKNGLPLGVFTEKAKSKKEIDRIDHKIQRILPEVYPRKPNETKEEKKARKAEVKEHRRIRRVEKKINKMAFKEEQAHQLSQLANCAATSRSMKLAL